MSVLKTFPAAAPHDTAYCFQPGRSNRPPHSAAQIQTKARGQTKEAKETKAET